MKKMLTLFTILALTCISTAYSEATADYTGRIIVESKIVQAGDAFTLKIWLAGNNAAIAGLKIPLQLSSSNLTCNYVDFAGSLKPSETEGYSIINGTNLEISYIPPIVFPMPIVSADSGLIATLYLVAASGAPNSTVTIDSLNTDSTFIFESNTLHIWNRVELADSTGAETFLPGFTAGQVEIRHSTGIDDDTDCLLPQTVMLSQNFPNPFNPTTSIAFSLPEKATVHLEIYNLLGQRVATLVDRELTAGNHSFTWDAAQSPSGVYFYRLAVGNNALTKKMLLLK